MIIIPDADRITMETNLQVKIMMSCKDHPELFVFSSPLEKVVKEIVDYLEANWDVTKKGNGNKESTSDYRTGPAQQRLHLG